MTMQNTNTTEVTTNKPVAGNQLTVGIRNRITPLNKIRVEITGGVDPKSFKSRSELDKHMRLVLEDGRKLKVSNKFWQSFGQVFGLNRGVFDYFGYNEVFNRIAEKTGDRIRISAEIMDGDNAYVQGTALTCTRPDKAVLTVNEVNELIKKYGGNEVTYKDGVASVQFNCPYPMKFNIGGDDMHTKFTMALPMDGYGLPASYLTIMRVVCTNGLVAQSKAFKTSFQMGSSDTHMFGVLDRAVQSFNNEEGFHALRQRLEASQKSWASLHNLLGLVKSLNAALSWDRIPEVRCKEIMANLDKVANAPLYLYGVTSVNDVSARIAKQLPVGCTVYDLINFATEVSSHTLKGLHSRNRVNAWVGELLVNEYDLENSKEKIGDFADFFDNTNKENADKA